MTVVVSGVVVARVMWTWVTAGYAGWCSVAATACNLASMCRTPHPEPDLRKHPEGPLLLTLSEPGGLLGYGCGAGRSEASTPGACYIDLAPHTCVQTQVTFRSLGLVMPRGDPHMATSYPYVTALHVQRQTALAHIDRALDAGDRRAFSVWAMRLRDLSVRVGDLLTEIASAP